MSRCASAVSGLMVARGTFVRSYRIQGVDGLNPMQEAERFLQSQRATKLTREANTSRFYKSRKAFGYAETKHLAETKQAKIESHMSPDIVIVSTDPFAAAPIETIKAQQKEGFRFVSALFAAPLLIPVFFVGKLAVDKESRQRFTSYFSVEHLSSKYGIPFKKGTISLAINTPDASSVLSNSDATNPDVVSVSSPVIEAEMSSLETTSPETLDQPKSISNKNAIESLVSAKEIVHSTEEQNNTPVESTIAANTAALPDSGPSLPIGASVQSELLETSGEDTKKIPDLQATPEIPVISDVTSKKAFVLGDDITEHVKELDKETNASGLGVIVPVRSDSVGSPVQESTHSAAADSIQGSVQLQGMQQSPKQKLIDSLEQLRLNPPQKGASRDEILVWQAKKAELKKAIKSL